MLSFRSQLILLLASVLVLFAVAAGFLSVATIKRTIRDDAAHTAADAADARAVELAGSVALFRQKTQALLESIASNCDRSGQINSACAGDAITAWMRAQPAAFADLHFPRSRRLTRGAPPPVRDGWFTGDEGRLYFALGVSDDYSGGGLTVALEASAVQQSFAKRFGAGAVGRTFLVGASGRVLAPAAQGALPRAAAQCSQGGGEFLSEDQHSGSAMVFVRPVPQIGGACVVAELPLADILRPVLTLRRRFALLVLAFFAVAVGLAFVIAHFLFRPLRRLTERVQRLSDGDYDSPIPQEGPSEMRAFAATFAAAAAALRESRAALLHTHERLQLTYLAARLWPWEISTATRRVWFTHFEGGAARMYEESLDDVMARVHADDREAVRLALERAVISGGFEIEFRYTAAPGTIWIASRGQRIDRPEGPILIGVNLDVTHRKRMEEIERERQTLAASGAIAAELAHEINNPLSAVTGALYLLRDHVPGPQQHYLEIAAENTRRIARIARQLLGVYGHSPATGNVDLCAIVEELVASHARQAEEKQIEIRLEMRSCPRIVAFTEELKSALGHVLSNSLRHLGRQGTIVVRVRPAREWNALGRRGVRVVIADNGAGIAAADHPQIFAAFFTTRDERGAGLGLWVTNNIIRKHYGSIRTRSALAGPRRGTTVSIFLPLVENEASRQHSPFRAA